MKDLPMHSREAESLKNLDTGYNCKSPILLLNYNRPTKTKFSAQAVIKSNPPKVYLFCDGPKATVPKDADKVARVRQLLLDTTVGTESKCLFLEENLGCRNGVNKAIDWFFENEEEGIIIEDDCICSLSFFRYCDELLERYRTDRRVGQISGFNGLGEFCESDASYHFSSFGSVWGWASWRRAWEVHDKEMESFSEVLNSGKLRHAFSDPAEYRSRLSTLEKTHAGLIDTWDMQWVYTRIINRFLVAIPEVNLVFNSGFDMEATHTKDRRSLLVKESHDIKFPLRHPNTFIPSLRFEKALRQHKRRARFARLLRTSYWTRKWES